MFVRWKVRETRSGETRYAVLVQSLRVDGKPRQRIVGILGCISIGRIRGEADASERHRFWGVIRKQLDQFEASGKIDRVVGDAAIERIRSAFPEPTDEEVEACVKARREAHERHLV